MIRGTLCKNLLWINRKSLSSNLEFSTTTAKRSVSTVKMAYNVFGDANSEASPVVVMHGLFGSKQNWRSISKAIGAKSNPKRKIITLDARNHGESPHSMEHSYKHMAADISDHLKDLGIRKTILMGHSMGGRAMMYFALKYPELVDRAIIVDITPINTSTSFVGMGSIFNAMKTINVAPNLSLSEGRKQVQQHLQKSIQSKETVDFLLLNLRKNEQKGFHWIANVNTLAETFDGLASFPGVELASMKYNGPVLFIGGKKSDFISEDSFPQVKELFPNAKLSWLDTGHLVQLEKPAEFIELVINFINV